MDDDKLVRVMSFLEGLTQDDWREFHSDSEVTNIAKDALELLKEQEGQKRIWLQCIADNQLAYSPTYGKDDAVAYWHKRGICDGLQMAYEIVENDGN